MSHEDCHIINRKVIIGNYTIKNLSMSGMNHDGVEGDDLLAEFHIVQEILIVMVIRRVQRN